ncbi:hypothetical protein Phum_PHUM215470 [Pediculus humanus corporis]|uniref:Uncharacterized protein n=1 Tax=Pediculus humanus subsp. corporis TaxID=121224 RepID=E0VHR3_PEDHC|nr:uncharacterized protein Phum_PHUM215470 [Pediculus humanus corporis]EEB12949.1 hypothetical protein Phum_PHUM215470 [Pediculus humanus corporis]
MVRYRYWIKQPVKFKMNLLPSSTAEEKDDTPQEREEKGDLTKEQEQEEISEVSDKEKVKSKRNQKGSLKSAIKPKKEPPGSTTTEIPMKGRIMNTIAEETNNVEVSVQLELPSDKTKDTGYSTVSLFSTDSQKNVTLPATEFKKITTVEKICPKKVETVVVSELTPIITIKRQGNKETIEKKTPILKHTTTTTIVKKTTLTTTEKTTTIGNPNSSKNENEQQQQLEKKIHRKD